MLTILNPHIDDFLAEPLSYRLVGRRPLKKYEYLLHEPIKRFGFVEVLLWNFILCYTLQAILSSSKAITVFMAKI